MQSLLNHRKGSLEVSHLAIWVLLVVFLLLMIGILVAVRGDANDTITDLCVKSGGLIGC